MKRALSHLLKAAPRGGIGIGVGSEKLVELRSSYLLSLSLVILALVGLTWTFYIFLANT